MGLTDYTISDKKYFQAGVEYERERILNLRKEIINCVVDYGLSGETYLRVMRELEELIKGEQK
jgi:hypothetical protein